MFVPILISSLYPPGHKVSKCVLIKKYTELGTVNFAFWMEINITISPNRRQTLLVNLNKPFKMILKYLKREIIKQFKNKKNKIIWNGETRNFIRSPSRIVSPTKNKYMKRKLNNTLTMKVAEWLICNTMDKTF